MFLLLFAAACIGVVIGAVVLYLSVLREDYSIDNAIVSLSVNALLCFLILLILRYFVMLWFAFLGHLESANDQELGAHPPLVSVLVPAFNEAMCIESSIRSIAALDYPHKEIIVIDDGSTDDTYWRAVEEGKRTRHVEVRVLSQPNGGKATALNRGIREARGAFVMCVDGDSNLAPRSLREAMRHFGDPTVVAVAGNVKVVNRRNLLTWLQALEYVEGLNLVRSAQAFFRTVNIIPGPVGIFRREALVAVGGYATETFAEDCDLTLALLGAGWKIKYEPRAIAYTEAPETLYPLLKQRYRWTRGILQALRKHRGLLVASGHGFGTRVTIAYMMFEAVLWPAMNVFANAFFLLIAVNYGTTRLLALWWLQLTMLDAIGALFSAAAEKEDLRLVPYSLVYRMSYILLIDICKVLATFEELLGVRMGWGKLERLGRLST
jgi:cellulose synthase/poly-beta-1,6-N-acetylglucosamine synthase-like glycosyltransferase